MRCASERHPGAKFSSHAKLPFAECFSAHLLSSANPRILIFATAATSLTPGKIWQKSLSSLHDYMRIPFALLITTHTGKHSAVLLPRPDQILMAAKQSALQTNPSTALGMTLGGIGAKSPMKARTNFLPLALSSRELKLMPFRTLLVSLHK
jgi:hypothetical protein